MASTSEVAASTNGSVGATSKSRPDKMRVRTGADDNAHIDDHFALQQRPVKDGLGIGILAKGLELDVANDTHDFHPGIF